MVHQKTISSIYSPFRKNSESNPHLLIQNFHELHSNYTGYQHICTDGSKEKEKVDCVVLTIHDCQIMHIPNGSSVLTTEAKAIDLALDLIDNCYLHDKFVICSDSLSVLQALNHTSSKSHKYKTFCKNIMKFQKLKTVVFCWVPSHIGIHDNEEVDKKAKQSLNLYLTFF